MDDRSNKLILVPVLAVLFVMIGYQYICPAGSNSCHFKTGEKLRGVSLLSTPYQDSDDFYKDQDLEDDSPPKLPSKFNFTERDLDRHVEFNIKEDDVIVFLHIQKTGGTTFGRHLVRNIRLEQPCDCKPGQKKCTCHRPGKEESWLFSRFSTGWSCGLHADWTELTNCVPVIMDKKEAQRNKRYVWVMHGTYILAYNPLNPLCCPLASNSLYLTIVNQKQYNTVHITSTSLVFVS